MEIVIKGGNSSRKRYAQSITEFVALKLMPRLAPKLRINIEIIKGLSDKEDVYGDCIYDDEEFRPKEFTIRVDSNLKMRAFIETIAHEMVHVKQFARGELYQSSRTAKHRWQGNWLKKELDYWDRPWEIEAHGREVGLFIQWAQTFGHASKPWSQDSLLTK